ncbi:hypothetical protein HDU77_007286 [Chytriomyces hyalinus]|nr:hypothetical protein HDU77_007286 [Chytriomyces hyalinus]
MDADADADAAGVVDTERTLRLHPCPYPYHPYSYPYPHPHPYPYKALLVAATPSPTFQFAMCPDVNVSARCYGFNEYAHQPSSQVQKEGPMDLCAMLALPDTPTPDPAEWGSMCTTEVVGELRMHHAGNDNDQADNGTQGSHSPSHSATLSHRNLRRSRFSKETMALLKREYATHPVPTPARIEALAAQLDTTNTKVKVWFQNYRATRKGKGHVPLDINATPLAVKNRPRARLAKSAVVALRREFHTNPIPSSLRIERLALDLNIPHEKVKMWFQNVRARPPRSEPHV